MVKLSPVGPRFKSSYLKKHPSWKNIYRLTATIYKAWKTSISENQHTIVLYLKFLNQASKLLFKHVLSSYLDISTSEWPKDGDSQFSPKCGSVGKTGWSPLNPTVGHPWLSSTRHKLSLSTSVWIVQVPEFCSYSHKEHPHNHPSGLGK